MQLLDHQFNVVLALQFVNFEAILSIVMGQALLEEEFDSPNIYVTFSEIWKQLLTSLRGPSGQLR